MNFKKSIFSYIIWAVYAFLCGRGVLAVLDTAEITDILEWPYAAIVGGVCAYLLLTAGVFFALRTICREIGEHIADREHLEKMLSVILPVVILIGAVVYLVLFLLHNIPLTLEDDSYYRQAVVSAGKNVPFAVHGASWLYPCLLHVMLLIFGNTPFAGVVLQIILFFACLLLVYSGMQAFAGVVPAAVSMAALGFLPVSLQFVFSLTPELFYLTLYLFGFFLTGMVCKKFRDKDSISAADHLPVFLLGIYVGFLIYLDVYSVSLYLFLSALYFAGRKKAGQIFGANLTMILGGAAGVLLMVLAASWMGVMSISEYCGELLALYTQNISFDAVHVGNAMLLPDVTAAGSLVLITAAFFVIPAFFIWKENRGGAFILNLLFVCILSVFSVFKLNAQMIAAFSWSILSGLGLSGAICLPGREKESVTKELQETEISEESLKNRKEETKKTENREQGKPAPGEPLHNPLPVPKKISRPQIDFAHDIKDSDMKYDIDVADDDDFDV